MPGYSDLYKELQGAGRLSDFTPETLSGYFGIPEECFVACDGDPDILRCRDRRGDRSAEEHLLKGTFFFRKPRKILRGHPKIFYGRPHQASIPFAAQAEAEILSCLRSGPILFEEKIDGVNIRVHEHEGEIRYATRERHDGKTRAGPHPWGEMAREIIERKYPKTVTLVRSGYVPVFEIVSPAFAENHAIQYPEEDAILVDVITPGHRFVTREAKEEFSKSLGLKVARAITLIRGPLTPEEFRKVLGALEREAGRLGIEGMVGKARRIGESGETGDQVFLKVKPDEVRQLLKSAHLPDRVILAAIDRVADALPEKDLRDIDAVAELVSADLEEDGGTALDDTVRARIAEASRERLAGS